MSRDELESIQLHRLKLTVRNAYDNVDTYRAKFLTAGVHPDDIRELSDIQKLPFTTKEDLRQAYPFGMFAIPREDVARIHASSGTTGRPTVVGYSKNDLKIWARLVARSLRASGVRPGMLVHNAYGYGLFTGGLGLHAGAEALGATVVPMSGGQTAKQIQLIRDFEPDVILCTPSYLLTIADAMQAEGFDGRASSLKLGVLGAEPWTDQMRTELEDQLDIDALDIYGLSEVMGPGVGNECLESKDGPHLWEDHFLPEIIAEDGTALPDGEPGELVFTTLTKEAMPVIRYRTRDLTRLLPGSARPGMRRMERITGRNDDMIILRGVNLFPTQIEELLLGVPQLSPHFVLELSRRARLDELTVRVERRVGSDYASCEAASQELMRIVKTRIGSSIRVAVVDPGTIERSTGKFQRVHDLREP
ncbi:MAG: phenylacetate--CoA ligase PaaK [Terrimesophilobacter sp.]